jgi:hypothetical protein
VEPVVAKTLAAPEAIPLLRRFLRVEFISIFLP